MENSELLPAFSESKSRDLEYYIWQLLLDIARDRDLGGKIIKSLPACVHKSTLSLKNLDIFSLTVISTEKVGCEEDRERVTRLMSLQFSHS